MNQTAPKHVKPTTGHDVKGLSGKERRRLDRLPFHSWQQVADFNGGFPSADELRPVECFDLSAGGFSYFSEKLPEKDTIICVFGSDEEPVYITAQVRFTKRVQRGQQSQYLVGCRFLQKLSQ